MMTHTFNESVVEQAAIEWLCALGYTGCDGLSLGPDTPAPERPMEKTR